MKSIEILFKSIFFILILFSNFAFSKSLNKIEILGNDRISSHGLFPLGSELASTGQSRHKACFQTKRTWRGNYRMPSSHC